MSVKVESSKPGDCPVGSTTTIDVPALQEMHNQFRRLLASATEALAKEQGRSLPSGPAAGATVSSNHGQNNSISEDAIVRQEVRRQQEAANQSEAAAQSAAGGSQ